MKTKLVLFAVCLMSVGLSQRLEKSLYLPDSLSGLTGPNCLAYNRFNRTFYVAGDGRNVIAIAESTAEKVARIDVGEWVNAICCDPVSNKVYVAISRDTVVVIDGASNTVRARLPAVNEPAALHWDSAAGKVYCGSASGHDVTVIDVALDSVVATIEVGRDPVALACDPSGAKVYCALSDEAAVVVIDALADTVLSTIEVGEEPFALLSVPGQDRVYCANRSDDNVSVISTLNDSVVATVTTARYPRALACDPARNRLYVACERREVTVVDCAGDTVFARVAVTNKPWSVVYNGASDRVYCADYWDQVIVIDAAADTLVKTLAVAPRSCALALNADLDEVYCVSSTGNAATVIDASQDTVAATVPTGSNLDFAVFSERSNKLYVGCRVGAGGHLAVIDGTSNDVLRFIDVDGYGANVCYDSALDKIYVGGGGDSILTAVDCAGDSVVAAIVVPAMFDGSTCSNPVSNKVYSTTGQGRTFTVVDAVADTVIKTIEFASPYGPWGMCYNPANNLVYVHAEWSDYGSVFAIDGSGDTIVAEIYSNLTAGGPMIIDPFTNIMCDADGLNSDVSLIDCTNNRLLTTLYVPGQPSALCCDTRDNKIFIATLQGDNMWVFVGLPPRYMNRIPISGTMMDVFYNPLSDRVYCQNGNILVIDAAAEAVIDSFPANSGWAVPAFAMSLVTNRVYALDEGSSRLLVIADSLTVGLQDAPWAEVRPTRLPQTIVSKSLDFSSRAGGALLDIMGRRVMRLKSGANDVSRLAPGVYFVHEESAATGQGLGRTRKVLVTR